MDVYFPPDAHFLPQELAQLPHTSTSISVNAPPLSLSQSAWNISSLENTTFHDHYHPLAEVQSFIKQLAATYPNITRLVNLGLSAEGREMNGLTISTGSYNEGDEDEESGGRRKKKAPKKTPVAHDGEKLGFVIVGAQHAREVCM